MEKTIKGCKHDFKTLQQQISIGEVGYVDGLIQCKKCLKCFCYGFDRGEKINKITSIKIKGQ